MYLEYIESWISRLDRKVSSTPLKQSKHFLLLPDCAFVGLSRWSECDTAIKELHNQPCPYDTSKNLTVKYANMHQKESTPALASPSLVSALSTIPANMPQALR